MTRAHDNPFVLPLDRIPDEGLEILADASKDPEFAALLTAISQGDVAVSGRATLFVRKWPRRIDIEGSFDATVGQTCSRGLDPYPQPLRAEVRHILFRSVVTHGADVDEVELGEEDLDRSELIGEELRLLEVLAEELELALPMRPLCIDPCEGPCPSWGRDVPLTEPEKTQESDPRRAALADLKLKK